jgi:hypothetical protein
MLAGIRDQLVKLESTTGARHKRDIEGLRAQLKDITRQLDTLIGLLTEVEHRRTLLTKSTNWKGNASPWRTGYRRQSPAVPVT